MSSSRPGSSRATFFETGAVAVLSTLTAMIALRFGSAWRLGVIGNGDAWQNLWNFVHVDFALRGAGDWYRSVRVWAPEGASLATHTLSLTNSIPGALLGRLVGFPLAYNIAVLFSFPLAATAMYRLARRLGRHPIGSGMAAFVFAFAPPHFARAFGHLNLLGIGWIPLSLECLVVATRGEAGSRIRGVVGAALSLIALAFTDWYLALLGIVAAASFGCFEIVQAPRSRRVGVVAVLCAVAGIALVTLSPAALMLFRDSRAAARGHESKWCSVAITSIVIPGRLQVVSGLTRSLTERNHQNLVEGAGYLGIVPLLASGAMLIRRRMRELAFAYVAGIVGLFLSFGPRLRIFDHLLPVPLPYALLEWAFPILKLGGCVTRFEVLALLPLALGMAAWADSTISAGRTGRTLVLVAASCLLLEYAPIRPEISTWPLQPPDAAMQAIARSETKGNVLDVDLGTGALVRQLQHGRPMTFGYLSREPVRQLAARLEDPILGAFLDAGREMPEVPAGTVQAALGDRWDIAFVVAPDSSPLRERAAALGLPMLARETGRSVVYSVPSVRLVPVEKVVLATIGDGGVGGETGVVTWGFFGRERIGVGGGKVVDGRWMSREARILAPMAPGPYVLRVAAIGPGPADVAVRLGARRAVMTRLAGPEDLALEVRAEDLTARGSILMTITSSTFFAPSDPRELGVFIQSLEKVD